jgi:hypothetical protein
MVRENQDVFKGFQHYFIKYLFRTIQHMTSPDSDQETKPESLGASSTSASLMNQPASPHRPLAVAHDKE